MGTAAIGAARRAKPGSNLGVRQNNCLPAIWKFLVPSIFGDRNNGDPTREPSGNARQYNLFDRINKVGPEHLNKLRQLDSIQSWESNGDLLPWLGKAS
jgi:hypothetical protein